MKIILGITVLLLVGCGTPQPVNEFVSKSIDRCFENGGEPEYFSNGSKTSFKCNRGKLK